MNSDSLISIIVPVYKTEKYLEHCIESVVNQTYKNLEIILIDDGSPDYSPEICDKWAKKDPRIRVLHKENGGLSSARNAGMEIATGDYIMFVDSDDYLELDMAEVLCDLIKKGDSDVARCGFFFDNAKEAVAEKIDIYAEYPDYDILMIDLLSNGYMSGAVWNKLYKATAVKNIRFLDEDGCSEDIMFNFRLYSKKIKAVFCEKPEYHYMVRENSIVNSEFKELAYSIVRAKKIILNSLEDNSKVYPYAVKSFVDSSFIVLSGCVRNNAFSAMQRTLRSDIIRYRKFILKSSMFPAAEKIKTIALWISPYLFKLIIKIMNFKIKN